MPTFLEELEAAQQGLQQQQASHAAMSFQDEMQKVQIAQEAEMDSLPWYQEAAGRVAAFYTKPMRSGMYVIGSGIEGIGDFLRMTEVPFIDTGLNLNEFFADKYEDIGGWVKNLPRKHPLEGFRKGVGVTDEFLERDKGWKYFLQSGIGEAVGSSAGFYAAGGAKGFKAAALIGGLVGADETYDDAIEAGMDPSEAWLNYAIGFAFGSTEAIPVALGFQKADKLTGGMLTKQIFKNPKFNRALFTSRDMTLQALEEGLQEAGQAFGVNLAAKLTFDPQRDLAQDVLPAAGQGAAGGAVLQGLLSAVGRARRAPAPSRETREAAHSQALEDALDMQERRIPVGEVDGQTTYAGEFQSTSDKYLERQFVVAQEELKLIQSGMVPEEAQTLIDSILTEIRAEEGIQPSYGGAPVGGPKDLYSAAQTMEKWEQEALGKPFDYTPGSVKRTILDDVKSKLRAAETAMFDEARKAGMDMHGVGMPLIRLGPDPMLGTVEDERALLLNIGLNGYQYETDDVKNILERGTKNPNERVHPLGWSFLSGTFSPELKQQLEPYLNKAAFTETQRLNKKHKEETGNFLTREEFVMEQDTQLERVRGELHKWYTELRDELAGITRSYMKKLGITQADILLTDGQGRSAYFGNNLAQHMNSKTPNADTGRYLHEVAIDPTSILVNLLEGHRLFDKSGRRVSAAKVADRLLLEAKAKIYSSLAHELGHMTIEEKMARPIREAILTDPKTGEQDLSRFSPVHRALLGGYLKWVQGRTDVNKLEALLVGSGNVGPGFEAWKTASFMEKEYEREYAREIPRKPTGEITDAAFKQMLWTAQQIELLGSGKLVDAKTSKRYYHLSFDEYMAEMVARDLGRLKSPISDAVYEGLPKEAKAMFQEMRKDLRKVYQLSSMYAWEPASERQNWGADTFEAWVESLSAKGKLQQEIERLRNQPSWKGIGAGGRGKIPGLDMDEFKGWREGQDAWNIAFERAWGLLHLRDANGHIVPLVEYTDHVEAMDVLRNEWLARAEDTLKLWNRTFRSRGKKNLMRNFERSKFEETLSEKFLTTEQKKEKWFKGLTFNQEIFDKVLALEAQIRKDFLDVLNTMESVLIAQLQETMDPGVELEAEIHNVRADFEKMRKVPFFPLYRFGKHVLQVTAKVEDVVLPDSYDYKEFGKKKYKAGEMVIFEAYDSKKERDRQADILKRTLGGKGFNVGKGDMTDTDMGFQAMPLSLLRRIKRSIPNLTDAQERALDDAIQRALPAQGFRKRFLRRKKTFGWNNDGYRSYAAYMRSAAGHIAKVKYSHLLQDDIDRANRTAMDIRVYGDSTKRDKIVGYMRDHYKWMMQPETDWAGLRAFGFTWYIGYNIKSAIINFTQIPLVTYPYLGWKYGDARAIREIGRAMVDVPKMFLSKNPPFNAEEMKMVEQGMHEGWLNQSLATELAIANNSARFNSSWAMSGSNIQRLLFNIQEWGAMPFALSEKINRVATAAAAYRLEREDGASHEDATAAAKWAVRRTQYEYTRWNRPWLMRGRRSALFLFMQYVTNTMYFATGNNGASMRFMFMMLLLGGVMGMPGAEDITDMLQWLLNRESVKKMLGKQNTYIDLRNEAVEVVRALNMEPDLILHGVSSNTFGLYNISKMFGANFPKVDFSASISMGRIIPGVEAINQLDQGVESFALAAAERGTGAIGSGMTAALKAMMSNDPDIWRRFEKAAPTAIKNASRAYRLAQRGGEKTAAGMKIWDVDITDPVTRVELVLAGLGMTPRDLSLGWQGYIRGSQSARYYASRRSDLMRNFNYALYIDDKELVSDMRAHIREYNRTVPYGELGISGDDLNQSVMTYQNLRAKGELGIPPSTREIRLRQEISKVYEAERRPGR